MKRLLLSALAMFSVVTFTYAGGHNKIKASAPAPADDSKEIHWMSLDDVQVAMKKEPRKVWIDVYTGWCGWCKRMDKTTFEDPNVIKYMNEHIYAVKLDAEQKDDIRFMGKMFHYNPEHKVNEFAEQILQGRLSYPTGVFMEEGFQNVIPIPGYQDVPGMEMILKYLVNGTYKTTQFDQYQKAFKPTWAASATPAQ